MMDFDKTVIFIVCVTVLFAVAAISLAGLESDENAQIKTLKNLNIEKLYEAEFNSLPNEIFVEKKNGSMHWVDENGSDVGTVGWLYINTPNRMSK